MMSPQKFIVALIEKIKMSDDRSYTPNSAAMACTHAYTNPHACVRVQRECHALLSQQGCAVVVP